MKPKQNKEGWTRWLKMYREFEVECCDCGLVHIFQIRVKNGKVQWRANRKDNLLSEK